MPPPAEAVIRLARVVDERIVAQRLVRAPEPVAIGTTSKATFQVEGVPSLLLFTFREGDYWLRFQEDFDGTLHVAGRDVSLGELRASGRAVPIAGGFEVRVPKNAKGRVSVGGATLLFQVSAAYAPKEPAFHEDRTFPLILVSSLVVHFSFAFVLYTAPKPPEREEPIEQLPDRFAKYLLPVPKPEDKRKPPKETAAKEKPTDKGEAQKAPADTRKTATAGRQDAVKARAAVANMGLLKVLAAKSGSGGAIANVLGASTGAAEVASALEGASGLTVATSHSVGRKDAGPSGPSGIGAVGTAGGGDVQLAKKSDVNVRGVVEDQAPLVDDPRVDAGGVAKYVSARKTSIQSCYERELKRQPSLRGRLVVKFSIDSSGRVMNIEFEEDTLGSDAVAACVRAVVRSWKLPFTPDEPVQVAYPFVFAPSSG